MKKLGLIIGIIGFSLITLAQTNTFTGYQSGYNNTAGSYNTFTGYQSGYDNTTGNDNVFTGAVSGFHNTTGNRNTFTGAQSGALNTTGSYNTFAGYYSGNANTIASWNVFLGVWSGMHNTTGDRNVFLGYGSGYWNSTGHKNTFVGYASGYENTTGRHNTFLGFGSGRENRTGEFNTFLGFRSGLNNTNGSGNTFVGDSSGCFNTSGSENTFIGKTSGKNNTTGWANTFSGYQCGHKNTTGGGNTFSGYQCGYKNSIGTNNTFSGFKCGQSNTTGYNNTFSGYQCGYNNTTGRYNTFSGHNCGYRNTTGRANAFYGYYSGFYNETGEGNTAIGYRASPTGSLINSTSFGYLARATASNQVRIGNNDVTSIGGQVNWTTFSDGRYKKEVKDDVPGLEFINQLHPVNYKVDIETLDKSLGIVNSNKVNKLETARIQTGFIAQEVEEIVKTNGYSFYGIDAPKNEKDYYGIRYAEFVVPLVKAVQELNASNDELKSIIADQQLQINQLLNMYGMKSNPIQPGNTKGLSLMQNQPNPFSDNVEIGMHIPENVTHAQINIYTMRGELVQIIPVYHRGNTSITVQSGQLQAGTYVYMLIGDDTMTDFKKMVLIK